MREAQHTGDNFEIKLSPLCCTAPRQKKNTPAKGEKIMQKKKKKTQLN